LGLNEYKVLHIFALLFVVVAYGGAVVARLAGGDAGVRPARRWITLTHGLALVAVLVTGFGALAKLGMNDPSWPLWVWGKIVLWLVLGGLIALARRGTGQARLLWFLVPLVGALAAALVIYKPH
jgi:hypothetical protein